MSRQRVVASEKAVAQVLQMVAAPVLMLCCTPSSDYGTYAVDLTAVALLL